MQHDVLRIVYWKGPDSEWWVGQCVEVDVACQAKTLAQASDEMRRSLAVHLSINEEAGEPPFHALPQPQPVSPGCTLTRPWCCPMPRWPAGQSPAPPEPQSAPRAS